MAGQPRLAVRWVTVGVAVAGALAQLGLVALWPRGDAPELGVQPRTYVNATVTVVDQDTCQDPEFSAPAPCQVVDADLTSGPDDGDQVVFRVLPTQFEVPPLEVGDDVVLQDIPTSRLSTATGSSTSSAARRSCGWWLRS
jgi:hypothetical protein